MTTILATQDQPFRGCQEQDVAHKIKIKYLTLKITSLCDIALHMVTWLQKNTLGARMLDNWKICQYNNILKLECLF